MAEYGSIQGSQLQGPQIAISLFPDAMRAGADVGNSVKTPLQGIAEGVTGGLKQYNTQVEAGQEQQIRQAQIDQIPFENEIKLQQLENQRAVTSINQRKAELAALTFENNSKAEAAKAENELSVEIGKQKLAKAQSSPVFDRSIFEDQDANAALNSDVKLNESFFNHVIGRTKADGTPELSPEERESYARNIDALKVRQEDQRIQAIRDKANQDLASGVSKDFAAVKEDGMLRALMVGKNIDGYAGDIEAYPAGMKNYDPDTGKVFEGQDNSLQALGTVTEYEVFDKGVRTGVTINSAQYGKLYGFKDSYSRAYGSPVKPEASRSSQNTNVQRQPITPSGATNDNIVTQRTKEFNDLAKNPPPGISSGTLEDRLRIQKQEIRQKFSAQTAPIETPRVIPPPILTDKPEAADTTLSKVIGAPVKLNTEVMHTPNSSTWIRVNSNPLLSGEMALIKGLASIESGGNPNAISPTGVEGLLQVTKATAAQYGLDRNIPSQNVLAGKKFLFDNLVTFNGDLRLALTAYNAGPGTVREAVKEAGTTDWPQVKEELRKMLNPAKFKEVDTYADRVISSASHYVQAGDADRGFLQLLAENGLIKNVA